MGVDENSRFYIKKPKYGIVQEVPEHVDYFVDYYEVDSICGNRRPSEVATYGFWGTKTPRGRWTSHIITRALGAPDRRKPKLVWSGFRIRAEVQKQTLLSQLTATRGLEKLPPLLSKA